MERMVEGRGDEGIDEEVTKKVDELDSYDGDVLKSLKYRLGTSLL